MQLKITTGTAEFFAQCPAKVIGVTGTKGKGTTASLIAKMLEASGSTVHLGGNIGRPALSFLHQIESEDWVVLELSSFQLMDLKVSPHVGVMLMIVTDHLNWHRDLNEYLEAKQSIFRYQQPGDRAIFNACNLYSLQSGLAAPAEQVPYNAKTGAWVDGDQVKMGETIICSTADIAIPGRHNWDNVCAAITAVWPIINDPQPIRQAIAEFKGLEHHLQQIAVKDEVAYYDDSFSTNPDTAIAAINSFMEPKVLILGGYDKQTPFHRLADTIAHADVRSTILIGETAPEIKDALDKVGFTEIKLGTGKMKNIVKLAAKTAKAGDVVLLSPSCASFDMFANYKERGQQFQEAVHSL
jgi:UDP-N-acetylmuramoylalanine--D-glutamate ligase